MVTPKSVSQTHKPNSFSASVFGEVIADHDCRVRSFRELGGTLPHLAPESLLAANLR
jgi:hypothetical protein